MKTLLLALILSSSLFPQWSTAATFAYRALGNGNYVMEMVGEIAPGDSERLRSIIAKDPVRFLGTSTLSLHSPGGSVQEAIGISELLQDSGLGVAVERDKLCASSCFLIWAAADFRLSFATSRLVMHRPYIPTDSITVENFKEKSVTTGKGLLAMRQYLTEKNVSSAMIDRMMQLPSTEGYELSLEDRVQMGALSPVIEEKAIKVCGVSNSTFLTSPNLKEATWCVGDILKELRLPYLVSKIGYEAAIKANIARVAELRVRDGNAALVAGKNLPPVQHEAMLYFGCAVKAAKARSIFDVSARTVADAALKACEDYYDALVAAFAADLDATAGKSSGSANRARSGADSIKATIRKRILELDD